MTDETMLSHRDFALLRAVASGRTQLTISCEPDMFIDGLAACDQNAVHRLVHLGLIRAANLAAVGERVTAILTTLGASALNASLPHLNSA
ncbi:hypothetical protein SAMN05192558_12516 [Actinokineospora alba]|uniref:Uncharacterized protein n=1 Tax=Actinokineospora alba TaxID=504798 RepID=A0A1H0WMX7_9PSEU|nr:hypothetical protein [Actinokineospora alba]TDP67166.1 hypothetical protein C8E96_2691 [Actinokineospora alba]SDJ53675.1 hypothetical protein SAMN05421871_11916 [Actinokineospora alba]SDP91993.1 hypothetical protein SAMN05192558_12516 [Actinokineospora alba]